MRGEVLLQNGRYFLQVKEKNIKPKSGPVCKHRMLPYDQISCIACKILAKVVDYH